MPKYDFPGYSPTSDAFMKYRPKSEGNYHGGTDTPAAAGTPVYSEYDGKVFRSGTIYGYGKAVVVEFKAADGSTVRALYGHLGPDPLPQPGDPVYAGKPIPGAFVGSEKYVNSFEGANIRGSHLHREIIHEKARIKHPENSASSRAIFSGEPTRIRSISTIRSFRTCGEWPRFLREQSRFLARVLIFRLRLSRRLTRPPMRRATTTGRRRCSIQSL
jgi:murein DD-endopeptidase MepM/ murein hydrolase activator NlpD